MRKMYDATVTYSTLLARTSPGTGGAIVTTIKKGTNVRVLKESKGYCLLDSTVWVAKEGIEPIRQEGEDTNDNTN